ncbi:MULTISPECIES: hypothetical protein [Parabacteroides]|nr:MULTISPECIES: hypothetical protein [Parabacteroides]MDB9115168.1 hypothetical protein [Parabacteroides merdae]
MQPLHRLFEGGFNGGRVRVIVGSQLQVSFLIQQAYPFVQPRIIGGA